MNKLKIYVNISIFSHDHFVLEYNSLSQGLENHKFNYPILNINSRNYGNKGNKEMGSSLDRW